MPLYMARLKIVFNDMKDYKPLGLLKNIGIKVNVAKVLGMDYYFTLYTKFWSLFVHMSQAFHTRSLFYANLPELFCMLDAL